MQHKLDTSNFFNIEGESVFITGAAGQIGSSIIDVLLRMGVRVAAVDCSLKILEEKARANNWNLNLVKLIPADVSNKGEISLAFDEVSKEFGSIDHLINNAGVSVFEPFMERTEESIDFVMDVNLKGVIFCIQNFLKLKQHRNKSKSVIVNVASHYGLISPDPRIYTDCDRKNSEIYGATKAGIIQMTKYYAVHAANLGVRVNCVSPGGIRNADNPQGDDFQKNYSFRCPLGRMAETWEIIGPIIFLLSPAANYITGQNIIVDGGMTSW
jgi:NAD(P)-dependent dehydrogenase (short-subunit alcohol dehydrogenase family)